MPANATQMTLQEAQDALVLAQQEVVSASAALQSASDQVESLTAIRDQKQASYSEAVAAWEATKTTISGTSTTVTENVVQNGTFDNASAWSGIAMYEPSMFNNYYAAVVRDGILVGSYSSGNFYLQTGTFAAPTRTVSFAVDVWNNNNQRNDSAYDYYRIEFRTYDAAGNRLNYFNFQYGSAFHDWITRGATYNLSADAVSWDIGFRLADGGYWNGNYGPAIDNVQLFATMTTSTPDTYTYGEAETAAKDAAYQDLQAAQASLNEAMTAKASAQARLDAAIAEVARLNQLIYDLTPRLSAPVNLTIAYTANDITLSWTEPTPNLSGVMPERYAVMWSTTNFTQNGWGIASTTTSITIPMSTLISTAPLGSTFQFAVRSDNDTLALYSAYSNTVELVTVAPPWWQVSFNEGDLVSIGAPDGYVFANATAWYGSPTDPACGATVSDIVNQFVAGNSTASFYADNGVFGDPCGGVVKVLRMSTPVSLILIPVPTASPEPQPTLPPQLEPQPTVEPSPMPEPTPTPAPEPTVEPTPTPQPSQQPEPQPTPEPTPQPETTPSPQPSPEPSPTQPVEEPKPTPSPEPSQTPTEEPVPTEKPTEKPTVIVPTPEPTPSKPIEPIVPEEEPVVEIKEPITAENIEAVVEELAAIQPQLLTEEQQTMIVEAALETFASAEQESPEYEAALEALLVVAQADDIVLDEELAAIPLVGNVAGAAVEVFNALGNAGADMSPQVREQSEKVVIAAVIVGQVAMTATTAATSAAAAAARRP